MERAVYRRFLSALFALAAIDFAPALAWGQAMHLPASGAAPLGNPAAAAAMAQAHHLQMLKLFDLNANGVLDPNEVALAKSGLGHLLWHNGAGAAGGSGGSQNFLRLFDQNGNGQLEVAEMQLAQMMFASLVAGYSRPATGVSPFMPDQSPQPAPPAKGRKKRAQRVADFAKNNGVAGQQAPAKARKPANPKKKTKARGPMVEGQKAPADNDPAAGAGR